MVPGRRGSTGLEARHSPVGGFSYSSPRHCSKRRIRCVRSTISEPVASVPPVVPASPGPPVAQIPRGVATPQIRQVGLPPAERREARPVRRAGKVRRRRSAGSSPAPASASVRQLVQWSCCLPGRMCTTEPGPACLGRVRTTEPGHRSPGFAAARAVSRVSRSGARTRGPMSSDARGLCGPAWSRGVGPVGSGRPPANGGRSRPGGPAAYRGGGHD